MKSVNLQAHFRSFLAKEGLQGQNLLLSVSGGVDSMVLSDIARKSCDPKNLAVFHLDHQSRSDSEQDSLLVKEVCKQSDIRFFGETLTQSTTKNKEGFWRTIRQDLTNTYQQEFKAARVLTAHHATDLVETMIFRLTKGCGLSGLSPFDISTKPFWDIPKQVLVDYATQEGLTWNEDSTNDDLKHERNKIRHEVLPVLRSITPNLEKVFVTERNIFEMSADFIAVHTKQKLNGINSLPLDVFLAFHPCIQSEVLRQLSQSNTSNDDVSDCLRWLINKPKGNSRKQLGKTTFTIKNNSLSWEE